MSLSYINFTLKVLMLFLLLTATGGRMLYAVEQGGPTVPAWLAGRSELLPPISMNEFGRMELAWPHLMLDDTEFFNPPPAYWTALQTVVELGNKAVHGLIWLYAQDTPRSEQSLRISKSNLITFVLLDDPESVRWMLPLLRQRVQWLKGFVDRGEFDHITMSYDELGAIQGFMNIRGEESDYRNVMELITRIVASNSKLGKQMSADMLSERNLRDDQSRRQTRRVRYDPFVDGARRALERHQRKTKQGTKTTTQQALPVAPLPPVNQTPKVTVSEMEPAPPLSKVIATMSWIQRSVMIIAVLGLLWWLLKRRS